MLNSKSFLAVDFGAVNLKLAEFHLTEGGGLMLKRYGFKTLGQEGTQESTRDAALRKALTELLDEGGYTSKQLNLCAPGFHTFSKFVKLPPVDTSKVTQIIQYEAQQNVPFPLEEVVWDYQILGANATGELEVLLVAIKEDVVEGLYRIAESVGLRLQLVDVSPAALCNAFRYNYSDLEGCSLLLDIGAKTSNLLFFEKDNVYSRGINIGSNAITQEFAKESKLGFGEAERMKVDEGFVSLGGAYEEPDNPHQAAISKIARQVLTRLHIQVNQTVQFYRGQQGGSAPQRLFLSGGASIMPYTAQFFSEKLSLPAEVVEYFNPFRYVQIADEVNREELAKVAQNLGEVVGLGLRSLAHCPVELNLMPKSLIKRQQLAQKKPYFVAAAACLVLSVFAAGWMYDKVAAQKEAALEKLESRLRPWQDRDTRFKNSMNRLKAVELQSGAYAEWLEDRTYWANVLMQLRSALLTVEQQKEQQWQIKTGVWVERFAPGLPAGIISGSVLPPQTNNPAEPFNAPAAGSTDPFNNPTPPPPPPPGPGRGGPGRPARRGSSGSYGGAAAEPNPAANVELNTVMMTCRAVNLKTATQSTANLELAQAVAKALQEIPQLDPAGTTLGKGEWDPDPSQHTFTFDVMLRLKRPIKF